MDDHAGGFETEPPGAATEARAAIRAGRHQGPTTQLAPGYLQANLVVLPREVAFDFLLFATRNPKPCPIVEVVESGVEAVATAPGSDLRTDLPAYRLHRNGRHVDSATDASEWWRPDLVSFLLGCSFTFDAALLAGGVPVRHVEMGRNVPMFVTDRQCEPAGVFAGPLVVSYRPIPASLVERAVAITAEYPHAHGTPVHCGDPSDLGISNLDDVDFGEPVPLAPGEVPVFWACGVTPQLAIAGAGADVELAVTHEPGHMFVTDRLE